MFFLVLSVVFWFQVLPLFFFSVCICLPFGGPAPLKCRAILGCLLVFKNETFKKLTESSMCVEVCGIK